MSFEHEKKIFLKKPDKSMACEIDKAILNLVSKINKLKEYYTTSSCAGRIVLIKETGEKQERAFLFKKHEKVNFEEIRKALISAADRYNGKIYLKMEPCIMHIACNNFDNAISLVDRARNAGWKKSGIISRRYVMEMRSTEILAVPVADKGKIIIDNAYLKVLVSECNKKLASTRQKIKKLEGII